MYVKNCWTIIFVTEYRVFLDFIIEIDKVMLAKKTKEIQLSLIIMCIPYDAGQARVNLSKLNI